MDKKDNRFLSLDVFRGMTIVFMIIVNNGGGPVSFSPLEHAHWFGFTPTDLVFPSFLFAVGNAMSFAMKKFEGLSNGTVVWKIFKRALIIFLLGYLMYWFPFVGRDSSGAWHFAPIAYTRILGVLQRIALCYLFGSLIVYFIKSRTAVIVISLILLLGYWALLRFLGEPGNHYGMLTNVGTWIDKAVLGDNHLYHGEGVAFDPEGILSTLPAIVNVICGYYAGQFIQKSGKTYETIAKLTMFGALLIFLALWWNLTFPIGKKLWTSPFTLLTVGIDMVLISALIYVVELLKWNKGNWTSFFTTVGKNPLPVYLFSELLVTALAMIPLAGTNFIEAVNRNVFQVIAAGPVGSLLYAICYMLICWTVGKILDKNKIYIRV